MVPRSRLLQTAKLRAGFSSQCFASSASTHGIKAARLAPTHTAIAHDTFSALLQRRHSPRFASLLPCPAINHLRHNAFSTTARPNAISFRDLKGEGEDKPKTPAEPAGPDSALSDATAKAARSARAPPDPTDPAEQAYQSAKAQGDKERAKARAKAERFKAESEKEEARGQGREDSAGGKQEQEKKQEPPPPPHGNKSPIQVFMDTMKKEFQASKEWNEGTKQLASSAHQFTENESVKRARAAYSAASGAATSGTASALKGAAKTVGQGAAWTWDTTVVKGVRQGVNATGRAIDTVTKPVRETRAFKSVKDVIDDGSSSKYGGWVEKEERRKQRELRELQEAALGGRPGRRTEKLEEDPE